MGGRRRPSDDEFSILMGGGAGLRRVHYSCRNTVLCQRRGEVKKEGRVTVHLL